jgi:hypothetical protein
MADLALSIEMFPMPRARRSDPESSKQAAKRAQDFAATHAGRLLEALRTHGPLSPKQFHALTGLTHVQADRRRKELLEAGLIRIKTAEDGTPFTRDGCEVWEAVA